MLEFFNNLLDVFGKFISMLFELPFFPGISFGMIILTISVATLLLTYLIGRMK